MLTFRHSCSITLAAIAIGACAFAPASIQPASPKTTTSVVPSISPDPGDLEHFIERFTTDRRALLRFYNQPWSESRFDRMKAFYDEWLSRLGGMKFDILDQHGEIDYVLLRVEIEYLLSDIDTDRQRLSEMQALLPFRTAIIELEEARWRLETPEPQKAAQAVTAITDAVKAIRKRVQKEKPAPGAKPGEASDKDKPVQSKPTDGAPGTPEAQKPGDRTDGDGKEPEIKPDQPADAKPPEAKPEPKPETKPETKPDETKPPEPKPDAPIMISPALARRTAGAVSSLRSSLNTWFNHYDGFVPEFNWWLRKPYKDAADALDDYAKFLREEIAEQRGKDEDPLVGDPIGEDALALEIRHEFLPYGAADLIDIAEKEFAWCEAEMKKAAAEMGLNDDWKAALAKVKEDHVPPGEQAALVAMLAKEAIAYLKEKDLITIPPLCEETWRLAMLNAEAQKTLPFAVYGDQAMMVAYPTDSMSIEDRLMSMRGNNIHFTRNVAPHELIPGHHLQGFMASRIRSYRSLFSTPFFVEGWALYWEMTFWELGYAKTPEDRIGMLFWRMHRCARIIVSLKYHLKQMSPQQMIDFLVDRVGHEKHGATSEVRRFIGGDYSPLYQCGYMIGGLQLRALRKETVDAGTLTNRQFHDQVLTFNSIPMELVRASVMNVPLSRDSKPEWRFAAPSPEPAGSN